MHNFTKICRRDQICSFNVVSGMLVVKYPGVFFYRGKKISEEADSLKFIDNSHLVHLKGIKDDLESASHNNGCGYKYLYDNVPSDFYIIVGTDNYVWGDRLFSILNKCNPDHPFLISGYGQTRNINHKIQYFPFGGCGIILTKSAARILYPKFDQLFNDWVKISPPNEIRSCDLAIGYYAEGNKIVMCRDYGLYSQNWMGDGKWGRLNEVTVMYDVAAVFHYIDDLNMRLYRKVPELYKPLYVASLQFPNHNAYQRGNYPESLNFRDMIMINTLSW